MIWRDQSTIILDFMLDHHNGKESDQCHLSENDLVIEEKQL